MKAFKNIIMRKKYEVSPLIVYCIVFLVFLVGFSLTRLLFWIYLSDYFVLSDNENILWAFIHGVRFDASLIAILNAPLLIYLFFSIWFSRIEKFNINVIYYYCFLVTLPALIINIIDIAYFPYSGKRSGPEVFSMLNDLSTQCPEVIYTYWVYVLFSFIAIILYYFVFRIVKRRIDSYSLNSIALIFLLFLCFYFIVIAGRGGTQSKPIRTLTAYSFPESKLGALVLNTPFSLLKEEIGGLKRLDYFHDGEIKSFLNPAVEINHDFGIEKDNIVILILESFGLEYFGPPYGLKSYVPFLQKLASKGMFFPNGIANGRRSIEAVPSILAGIPSLMSEAFIRSPYQSNEIYGIGNILKPYGYESAFFHGAKNGSMYFDDTTYRLGFDHYYGKNEFPDQSKFDGQWGIFDEPFLQFTVDKIDTMPRPFLAGIFTISSHPPYTLPEEYSDQFKSAEIPMHRVIQYSDHAIKKFFEYAKTKDWFEDTLFIISADHTSDNYDRRFASSLGRHQIPIILYQAANKISVGVRRSIAQQVDIPATILDYLNLPEEKKLLPFGRSLLSNDFSSDAILHEEGAYWLLTQNEYVKMSQADGSISHGELPDTFQKDKLDSFDSKLIENRLKAYLQIYNNGLIDNELYRYSR
ncbi:sulfatase-like hydrolase/transferase [Marinomonas sp. THO17]|uniref:LTA synthase family protein n=1 Tax=Marinomonas sp. THO17 TaxID=3149048 RepID=UPI00336C181D